MTWHRFVVPALVACALVGGGWLSAQERGKERRGKRGQDPVGTALKNLDLTEKQKEQAQKIVEEYSPKVRRIQEKLRELQKEMRELVTKESQAIEAVLTDQQKEQFQQSMQRFQRKGGKGGRRGGGGAGG